MWRRPVLVRTIAEGKPALLRFDGNQHESADG
jgi:hypothetical protein